MKKKRVFLLAILFSTMTLACSCNPSPAANKENNIVKVTPVSDYSVFKRYLDDLRSQGKLQVAENLESTYSSEPEIAMSLCFIEKVNPAIAQLITQQPWFLDGIDDNDRKFIRYGLGNGEQGIALFRGMDNLLTEIVVDQQYLVEKIEINRKTKDLMFVYNNPNDLVNGNKDMILNVVKSSASEIEKLNGAEYPLDTLTVFLAWLDVTGSFALNGTIVLETYNELLPFTVIEEVSHALISSRKGVNVHFKEWIGEGLANFSEAYIVEQFSIGDYPFWENDWNATVQQYYDDERRAVEKEGIDTVPLSILNGRHSQYAQMGFLFFKDLYDILGHDYYVKTLSSIYKWQSQQPPFNYRPDGNPLCYVDEYVLEDMIIANCTDEITSSKVKELFDDKVWAKNDQGSK